MSRTLTIGSQSFEIPLQGENPDYGDELTEFFTAISDALADVVGPADILLTTATIANNQVTPANIPGFAFSTASVRTLNAEYIIERSTVVPALKKVESGFIKGNYDGTNWNIVITSEGDASVIFSITPAGQVQYISDNMSGSAYTGIIRFKSQSITI